MALSRGNATATRLEAVLMLEKLGDARSVKELDRGLTSDEVFEHAGQALLRLGTAEAVEAVLTSHTPHSGSYWKLRKLVVNAQGTDVAELLIGALRSKRRDVCCRAAEFLGDLGDARAVEPLINTLTEPEIYRRYDDVRRLGDGDPKEEAARALGSLGDPRGLEPVIEYFKRSASRAAAAALESWRDPRVVDVLIEALHCTDKKTLAAVCGALAYHKDRRAIEPLVRHMGSILWSDHALDPVLDALSALGETKWRQWLLEGDTEGCTDPRVFDVLVAGFERGNCIAAHGLRNLGDPRAVEHFLKALDGQYGLFSGPPAADLAYFLVRTLAELREVRAVPGLISQLENGWDGFARSAGARKEAVKALGELGDKRAVGPLLNELGADIGEDGHLDAVAHALVTLADSCAIQPLISQLSSYKSGLLAYRALEEWLSSKPESLSVDSLRLLSAVDTYNYHRSVTPETDVSFYFKETHHDTGVRERAVRELGRRGVAP